MNNNQLTIKDAAKKIFEEMALDIKDKEVQEQMVQDLEQSIQDRIMAKMISALSDNQKVQFDELVERNASPEEIQEFISASVAGIPHIVSEAIISVRNEYLTK